MALSSNDAANIREYLLGKLSEDEQQKIEERLMVEDDLFEELEILKGELIEEYRDGELTAKERESFEKGYLASPEGRRGQAFTTAMKCVQPQPVGFFQRIAAALRRPYGLTVALASAAVVIVVGLVWLQSQRQPPRFVATTLTISSVTRQGGDAQYPRIRVPADTSELRITLTLPRPANPGARYRVDLDNRRETKTVETTGNDANSVSVVIPARQVPAGLYALVIYELKPDGTEEQIPGSYIFITQQS